MKQAIRHEMEMLGRNLKRRLERSGIPRSLAEDEKLANGLVQAMSALRKWVNDSERAFIAQRKAHGERFISIEEVADRLGRSVKAVRRGWRAYRYPFILGDGAGNLVAHEDGFTRWSAARTKRQSHPSTTAATFAMEG